MINARHILGILYNFIEIFKGIYKWTKDHKGQRVCALVWCRWNLIFRNCNWFWVKFAAWNASLQSECSSPQPALQRFGRERESVVKKGENLRFCKWLEMIRYPVYRYHTTPKPPMRVRLHGRSSGFSLGEWEWGGESVGEVRESEKS